MPDTQPSKSPGQIAYEADLAANPLRDDKTPRKTWDELGRGNQWAWHFLQTRYCA